MMPELHPHLRSWTGTYTSHPYPHDTAVTIGNLQPDQLAAAAGILIGLSPVLHDGYFDVDRQAALAAAAWSAPEPVSHLRALATATERAADTIDRLRDALLPAIDVFRQAQSGAAAAITWANTATDWTQNYVATGTPEANLRISICRALKQSLDGLRAPVESAMADLAGVIHLDPQDGFETLPVAGGLAPPQAPTATDRVARNNLEQLGADLVSPDRRLRAFAAGVLAGVHRAGGADGARLLIYDPAAFGGQGRAAIAVGDLAAADHLAVLTPGIGNSPDEMGDTAVTARSLIAQAERVAPGESTAVVLWFGYDIPLSDRTGSPAGWLNDAFAAADDDAARAGAALLADDTRWIARLAAPDATVTMIGHSMGSTTTSEAALSPLPVDNIVLLGSPGAGHGVTTADDYQGVTRENVFVLSHPADPVTRTETDIGAVLLDGPRTSSPFGPDPADSSFGAQVIDAPSTANALQIDGMGPNILAEHSITNYLTGPAGTAVAAVITGRTGRVPRKPGR
ncbi:alpha/beta fold hydrolase [Nakamurella lactea]|uniref:alpha/beta fold hydrolase n=1 Tax=Nakamurella lactea TaxID=459515 RepID=UPI00041ED005|nr:alpha/beta fold hydrolase [Nakamurella lactea]